MSPEVTVSVTGLLKGSTPFLIPDEVGTLGTLSQAPPSPYATGLFASVGALGGTVGVHSAPRLSGGLTPGEPLTKRREVELSVVWRRTSQFFL